MKKYDIAILAILKNEESFLTEWIDHYLNRNIDHLYLLSDLELLLKSYNISVTAYGEFMESSFKNNSINKYIYVYGQYKKNNQTVS